MFQSLKIYLSVLAITFAYPAFSFQNPLNLYDFSASKSSGSWIIVNDVVMGGVSRSQLSLSSTGTLLFEGNISLDYGGGFASVRSVFNTLDEENLNGILIMVKGDGKTYQLLVRQQKQFDGVAFFQRFETTKWE